MRAVLFLAANFVREQRLIIGLMSGWLIVFAVLFALTYDPRTGLADLETLYRQELAYGVVLGLFGGASMVFNERKSHRILAVLSKGLSRAQYLAGVLLGIMCTTAIYYVLVAITNEWLIHRFHFDGEALTTALSGWLAAQLAAAIGLAFGTFMHPLLAAASAAVVSAGGMVVHAHPEMFPVSYFLRSAIFAKYAEGLRWQSHAGFALAVAIETAIAFTIAVLVFHRRDVSVPVE
jgi:hypothetical protein